MSDLAAIHEAALAQAWKNVEALRALADKWTEDEMNPQDFNGHVAKEPDPEVRRITSAVVTLERLGWHWDADSHRWVAPEGDE